MRQITKILFIPTLLFLLLPTVFSIESQADAGKNAQFHLERKTHIQVIDPQHKFSFFKFNSGYHFEYPDAVRGIYLTGNTAGGSRFQSMVDLVDSTNLNAMVIDIKEDMGFLTFKPEEGSSFEEIGLNLIQDPEQMMKTLEEKQIYPIARIVVFKDTQLATARPDLTFVRENGEVWLNNRKEAFVNPFLKEVWDYNIEIAKMAAELGFKEIQFDYVRFPEGFENIDDQLQYSLGDYANSGLDNIKMRVEAVTDFVKYAREELAYYDVDVSVDIFGYAATIPETPGIGQNFSKIAENVDVISSMIYPSHWSNNYFGIEVPDKEPYRLVSEYIKVENDVLSQLDNPPISRPWIQDFSAPWLYQPYGQPTFHYGKEEVEAQIRALKENGVDEYLLWNASNIYTEGVDYQ